MDTFRQGLTDYRIPAYIEEILTHNYCPHFIRMNIVRELDSYRFFYRPGNLAKVDISSLDAYRKLMLLKTLITICRSARGYLIAPDSYLLEPELVFSTDNRVDTGSVRLIFYPDVKKMKFEPKLLQFADRIRSGSDREERELFDQFRAALEDGGANRASLFLDKTLLRMEYRGAAA